MQKRYGRFQDLRDRNIVHNWPTLSRWIAKYGFPPPIRPSPGTTLFDLDEIDAWLESRRAPRPAPEPRATP